VSRRVQDWLQALGRRFAQPAAAWIETLVLVAAVPLLGALLHRHDPLFARSNFPWPLLVPLVAGLQYGFAAGFIAASALVFLVVGAWRGVVPLAMPVHDFPVQLSVGLLLAGMVAGEFSDLWRRRVQVLETDARQLRRRFDAFARHHQVLRTSHDLLEAGVARGQRSLREALRVVYDLAQGGEPRPTLANEILQILAESCSLRIAALYLTGGADTLAPAPDASLGRLTVRPDDALVREALRARVVASTTLGDRMAGGGAGTDLLAVAPLVDVDGRLWGLLAVADMPFMAFTGEGLRRMAIIAGRIADTLAAARDARGDDATARARFVAEVRRAAQEQSTLGVVTARVDFLAAASVQAVALRILADECRATDRTLVIRRRGGAAAVSVLLPLTSDLGLARFIARVEARLAREIGASLPDGQGLAITRRGPVDELAAATLIAEIESFPDTTERESDAVPG
jgi:hypothetical protein